MTTNDPISDMLTRIRNAATVKKTEVMVPFSKIKDKIAQILKEEGYIEDFEVVKSSANVKFNEIIVYLKYVDGKSSITNLKRISKPGRRVYVKKGNLPIVLNRLGIAIMSTPKGIMTNKKAKKFGVGGEIFCEIY